MNHRDNEGYWLTWTPEPPVVVIDPVYDPFDLDGNN